MEKTRLEATITKRAEKRFQKNLDELTRVLSSNPIASKIQIKIGDISVSMYGNAYANNKAKAYVIDYGNYEGTKEDWPKTNMAALKAELIEKYRDEETDTILSQLGTLENLFLEGR